MKRHAAPIIAAILLLLPVLYVGSYLSLVKPGGGPTVTSSNGWYVIQSNYRWGGNSASVVFFPLEQIDRKVRPGAWEPIAEPPRLHRITIGDDGLERIGFDFE